MSMLEEVKTRPSGRARSNCCCPNNTIKLCATWLILFQLQGTLVETRQSAESLSDFIGRQCTEMLLSTAKDVLSARELLREADLESLFFNSIASDEGTFREDSHGHCWSITT